MTSRERVQAAFSFIEPDRVPIFDAYWPETIARWHDEGMPKEQSPWEYFDTDIRMIVQVDHSLQLPEKIIEQTDEYVVKTDGYGITAQTFRHKTTTPHYIDFLIKTREEWNAYKHHLAPSDTRIDWTSLNKDAKLWTEHDKYVLFGSLGLFETLWRLVGIENTLMQMILDPQWLDEILHDIVTLIIGSGQMLVDRGIDFHGLFIGEDIAYRKDLMFSREHLDTIFGPHYRRLFGFFKGLGKHIIWHSDGLIDRAIPSMIDLGVNCLHPLEAKAGMDVRQSKAQFNNRIAFMGNIDVREMAKTKDDIYREIAGKLPVAMRGGGYVYHSDHSIPPDVSFENYCYVIDTVRQLGVYT
jgi:uroporphyrinogen decarboxylase